MMTGHVMVYAEPWAINDSGEIMDGDGTPILLPIGSPKYNTSANLAARVVACVNATRTLHSDTLQRAKLIIKPSRDHVILASQIDDMIDWCREVLEEAGFEVKEK